MVTHPLSAMHIVTLFEHKDRAAREALDRYLNRLSIRGVQVNAWNTDQMLPGNRMDDVLAERMAGADLVLLLASQDFWASEHCYAQAEAALRSPGKKIAVVNLRPNSIDDTPFKDLPRFPKPELCISHYADPDQGYWDVYQGIMGLLDPGSRYHRRPKVNVLRATIFTSAALLLWTVFVLLLPAIYPQTGLKMVSTPLLSDSINTAFYKLYKLDNAPQDQQTFSFFITQKEAQQFGHLVYAQLDKVSDETWTLNRTQSLYPHDNFMDSTQTRFFGQCVMADFAANDVGEYHFWIEFEQPLAGKDLSVFANRLSCDPRYCSVFESKCDPIGRFQAFHHLYFEKARLMVAVAAFLLLSVLLYAAFTLKKIAAHATP